MGLKKELYGPLDRIGIKISKKIISESTQFFLNLKISLYT